MPLGNLGDNKIVPRLIESIKEKRVVEGLRTGRAGGYILKIANLMRKTSAAIHVITNKHDSEKGVGKAMQVRENRLNFLSACN